jgi:hypothetical protein
MRRIAFLCAFVPLCLCAFLSAAPLIIPKPDAHGQPLPTWQDPPAAVWNGQAELPEGEYTLAGVKTDRLVLPMRGRVVIRDGTFKRIERFSNDAGDLEVVIVGCTFTEQFAIHMPKSCMAVALVDCVFSAPDSPRQSYVYISAQGPNYVDRVRCSGGYTPDSGQHAIDLGTEEGKVLSVRGLTDSPGSSTSINVHVKPGNALNPGGGLEVLWVSESKLRGRCGLDVADVDNSKKLRTRVIKLRNVEFAMEQHPKIPMKSRYALFPSHATDEVHGLGGVIWTSTSTGAWPVDAEYGSIRPKIVGPLPWNDAGQIATTTPTPPATQPTTPPATQPTNPPATQPTPPPATQPATRPASAVIEFTAPDGTVHRFPLPATSN